MDAFELQSWERELAAWRKKLAGQAASAALLEELEAAASEIERVRARLSDHVSGERVTRHLLRLRALWDYLVDQGDESRTTPA